MAIKIRASRHNNEAVDNLVVNKNNNNPSVYMVRDKDIKHEVKPVRNPPDAKVKHRVGRLTCLILKENKSCVFLFIKTNKSMFSYDRNTYFLDHSGNYDRGKGHVAVYMEGVSLPVHHGLIEKETITKLITNLYGEEESHKITKIKGLKYDSELIDMLLNRKLADAFTKVHLDMPNLILAIALIVSIIIGVAGIGVQFYLHSQG